jgi:hypothetical protein
MTDDERDVFRRAVEDLGMEVDEDDDARRVRWQTR